MLGRPLNALTLFRRTEGLIVPKAADKSRSTNKAGVPVSAVKRRSLK